MSKVDDTLNLAAELVEKRGWTQKTYETRDGQVCLMGAVHMALGIEPNVFTDDETFNIYLAARDRLQDILDVDSPIEWNDQPERTKEQVVSALRAAARHAD